MLLKSREVIAINQDPLGVAGDRVWKQGPYEVLFQQRLSARGQSLDLQIPQPYHIRQLLRNLSAAMSALLVRLLSAQMVGRGLSSFLVLRCGPLR